MGIPAIGVVAVLVASVAFSAWIQIPGVRSIAAQPAPGCNCFNDLLPPPS